MKTIKIICGLVILPIFSFSQFVKLDTKTTLDITEIVLLDENIALSTTDQAILLRTIDGGINWDTIDFPNTTPFRSINFPSSNYGYIMNDSFIFRSEDSGLSWEVAIMHKSNRFIDLCMVNDSTGLLLLRDKEFLKEYSVFYSDDYFGRTLKLTRTKWEVNMNDLHYTDFDPLDIANNTGYIATDTGILYAYNLGYKLPLTGFKLNGISFPSMHIGYMAGDSGVILKTNNGDDIQIVWELIENFPEINLNDIFFTNNDTGYVVGDSGFIMRSFDGGQSWYQLESNTSEKLLSIDVINDSIIYVTGENGLIIKSTNWGGNGIYLSLRKEMPYPNEIIVYPNPVDNLLNIRLENQDANQILIYNMQGSIVYKKETEYLTRLQLDISNFNKGAYLLQLITKSGNVINTIILKL